jgi:acetyl esterase/lipase
MPQLDPELAAALDAIPDEYLVSNVLDFDDLPESRERMEQMNEMMMDDVPDRPGVEHRDVTVPSLSDDHELSLRIHRPVDAEGPLPCLYWIHGGGMVLGSIEQEDPTCERLVDELDCVVVAVEYRLAPEHPYPTPVDDCYAGLEWVAENADELGVDDSRIAVAGQSAGGGLSAAIALRARDEDGPELCFQFLIYPMLDDRNVTESSEQITDIGIWDRDMNVEAWDAYLGERSGSDELPAYAAPARAGDLSDLPPAFLDVGTHDAFRDENVSYARRLIESGVQTEFHLWPGAYHAFEGFAPESRLAEEAWSTRIGALRRAFAE